MPIYEYRCAECGCEKEYLQKVSDPLKTDCPECGKPALQKKLTAAGFQLKGSGWYVTDFRDGGKKTESKKSGTGNDSATKPSESKATDSTSSSGSGTGGEAAKSDASGSASSSKTDSAGAKSSTTTTSSGS